MPDATDDPPYLAPYLRAAERHGAAFDALLWASPRTQEVRFDAEASGLAPAVRDLLEASNANAARLNRHLFSHRDYAIVAVK